MVVVVVVAMYKAGTGSDQDSWQRPRRREGWLLDLVRSMLGYIRKVNLAYCENSCGGTDYSYPRLSLSTVAGMAQVGGGSSLIALKAGVGETHATMLACASSFPNPLVRVVVACLNLSW